MSVLDTSEPTTATVAVSTKSTGWPVISMGVSMIALVIVEVNSDPGAKKEPCAMASVTMTEVVPEGTTLVTIGVTYSTDVSWGEEGEAL